MKSLTDLTFFAALAAVTVLPLAAKTDAAASPYFQIVGDHEVASGERLPLKASAAKVEIAGTIAKVHLTQRYANAGNKPIEAIYIFPASTRAAVHGMTLTTSGRVIAAKIAESSKAKAGYETAKSEKKTAALLEEHRANVFQMSVANLLPGDDIEVSIDWTETIPAVDSTYEFVLPTVVGPRYAGGGEAGGAETWTANPHLAKGEPEAAPFKLDAILSTTLPLAEVRCPSHPAVVDFKAKDRAGIRLGEAEGINHGNRDFILRWKLGNPQVDAGLLLNRGDEMNHFLLQVAPPPRVTPDQIPPRDYVMVIDVSGSMEGFPFDTAKVLLRNLVHGLRPDDTFNVVSFAGGNEVLSPTPLLANDANLSLANRFIDGRHAGGGTELLPALKRSALLPGGEERSRSLLVITDGFIAADGEAARWVAANRGDANVFTFGIGSSVNRELIESMARAGGGEPVVVTTPGDAPSAAAQFLEMISSPVLAKVRVRAEGLAISNMEPAAYPDVFASRPLMISGTWTGQPKGRIVVSGIAGNGAKFEKSIDLAEAAAHGTDHPALPVLWARERVRRLTESAAANDESVAEVTMLGLSYSLLTPYTSFLAVDETPRPLQVPAETVKQPVPLPKGVTPMAAPESGTAMVSNGSVPEPGSVSLIAVLVVLLALQRQRDPN